MVKWQRFRYNPVLPLGKDGKRITGSREQIEFSRRAAAEGMVLLKNDGGLLPIKKGGKVALFGKASADYVKGGGGSGDTVVAYVKNLCEAMSEKANEGKVEVFAPLCDFYNKNVAEQYEKGKKPGQTEEPEIPEELFKDSLGCDIAVISVCRFSFEDGDYADSGEGGFFLTKKEKEMIEKVCSAFKNVAVVLNAGAVIDTSWFVEDERISAVLCAWQGGMEGAASEADILCGDVNPSGRLADTIAYTLKDYPSYQNFSESDDFVNYTEDVFVGYRYFETIESAKNRVAYPFGYGLSYTDFCIECVDWKVTEDTVSLCVRVKNIGQASGKEVVQVYSDCITDSYDLPSRELRAFRKTKLLAPGESVTLNVGFATDDLTVYDEKLASYVVPEGEYIVSVGKNIRSVKTACYFSLKKRVVKAVKNRCVPKKLPRRLKSDGSYEILPVGEYEKTVDLSKYVKGDSWNAEYLLPQFKDCKPQADRIKFEGVVSGEVSLDDFMESLSDDELITLTGGTYNRGIADTRGLGGLDYLGIPAIMTADGPAGLRVREDRGVKTTAFPIATAIACSWNEDLAYETGLRGAAEVEENNIGMWLTPAINVHRSPLCGRNFEYYSEDPFLTGKMASAMVKGIQSRNVSACVKHFCCNNKETNRYGSDSVVSERALREIYLKAFEIVVKESGVYALMTSYNKVNGTYTSENAELLRGILREEMGYDGLVITDWGNCAEHYREVLAGNNVKMPFGTPKRLKQQLEDGLVSREELKKNVRYLLDFMIKLN